MIFGLGVLDEKTPKGPSINDVSSEEEGGGPVSEVVN